MTRHIVTTATVILLTWASLDAGVRAASGATCGGDALALSLSATNVNPQLFKVDAGGRLDLENLVVTFSGRATQLGQFTAIGEVDPSTDIFRNMRGTLVLAQGELLNWSMEFAFDQPAGTRVFLAVAIGTGRFLHFRGASEGLATVGEDSRFTMNLEGASYFEEPNFADCLSMRSDCRSTCEESTGPLSYCIEQSGAYSITSFECCCCTHGFVDRCFLRP